MEEEASLKCGLEIHQQLDTRKLFCSCPSILRQNEPDYIIKRKLHPVAGEVGEIDIAAKFEAIKNLEFEYQGYYDNTCLVELDEEPPHQINQEALKIAVQLALLLNCEIIPYTQIMRKTVIDGSNVSGFQRTVLIARKGYVETKEGKVRIESLALEEDAARIIKKSKEKIIYRLDRLGIPLVEISTSPDIKSEKQAKEVALYIGEILRACKVKRGLGTIRQDVNMSIYFKGKQGARIEIKGVQEPELIEKTILSEIERQKKLIQEGKSEAEVRKALPNGKTKFLRPLPGAARMYPETDLPLLHISRDLINEAKRTLPKLKSEIRGELKQKGLSEEMIKLVLQENKVNELIELLHVYNNVNLVAKMLVLWPKEIQTKLKLSDKQINERLSVDILESVLHALGNGKINEADIKQILEKIASGINIEKALEKEKIENIEEEILKIVKEKPGLSVNAYMGLAMSKFKGKVSGKEIMEILKRILKI
ncbi:MAG: Glu-tRNA(Gln) amidotransferase subunit GatE [Candidatus Pacearchaeota archaeon]